MSTTRNENTETTQSETPYRAEVDPNTNVKLLTKSVFVVNVHSKLQAGEALVASVVAMNNLSVKNPEFKLVNILLTGTLERHHFWLYTKAINDENLRELLKDIPEGKSLDELALLLSKKFIKHAKKSEAAYIKKHYTKYSYNLRDLFFYFTSWEMMVPGICLSSSKNDQGNYEFYYSQIEKRYDEDMVFANALRTAIQSIIKPKRNLIISQCKRLKNNIQAFSNLSVSDFTIFVEICIRNFLIEEYAFLFAILPDMGYKSIFHTSSIDNLFKSVREMFTEADNFQSVHINLVDINYSLIGSSRPVSYLDHPKTRNTSLVALGTFINPIYINTALGRYLFFGDNTHPPRIETKHNILVANESIVTIECDNEEKKQKP